MVIYQEKWKSIEWLNICSGSHLHPVLPTSACRRPQSCTEGNLNFSLFSIRSPGIHSAIYHESYTVVADP